MTAGCEPTNQLWYADIQTLPRDPSSGALDFSSFDKRGGEEAKPLPVTKVISNFEASYDYVANEVQKCLASRRVCCHDRQQTLLLSGGCSD